MSSGQLDPYEEADYKKLGAKQRTNILLVKPLIGKVRPSTYNLPADGFVYGRRDQFDEEGVSAVVNSWQNHEAEAPSPRGRDFVALNRRAIVQGSVTSKDLTAFRSVNDARLCPIRNGKKVTGTVTTTQVDASKTYGKPSKPSTPIADVLNNAYQRQAIMRAKRAEQDKEIARRNAALEKKTKFGGSQHTRASLGHLKVAAPPAPEPFKLSKFKNVPSKIGQQGLSYQPIVPVSSKGATTAATTAPADAPAATQSTQPAEQQQQQVVVQQTA